MKGLLWLKRGMAIRIRHMFVLVLCIGIIAVGLAYAVRFEMQKETEAEARILTSSTLTDTINIAELSTAEFRYRGLAEVYSEKNRSEIICRVCYNAIVKAGVDINQVEFDIDSEKKTITATLPDVEIKVNIIDEQSMAVLPADANVGIARMRKCSKEDCASSA